MRLYDEAAQDLAISVVRTEATWRYLLTCTDGSDMECENWVVEDGSKRVVGYMRLPTSHFGEELPIQEVARLDYDAALATLNHLKTRAAQLGRPGIRLNIPETCSLMQVARPFTNREYGTYSWQIHVPDMPALLRALAPVFERRLARSLFARMTRDVRVHLYRQTILLRFIEGRLVEVADVQPVGERGPIAFPPLPFIPLLFGYRTLDELRRAYPDVSVAPAWRLLVETLFPKVPSFLYTVY